MAIKVHLELLNIPNRLPCKVILPNLWIYRLDEILMFRLHNILEYTVPACRRRQHLDNQILIHILDHSGCETQDSVEYVAMPVGWLQRPTIAIKKLFGIPFQHLFDKTVWALQKTSCKEILKLCTSEDDKELECNASFARPTWKSAT